MEESLEHIRESAETRMRKNAFMLHNYIELERVEKDRAVFKLDIRPESCNPYGLIHGGAIYTLADNATGAAAHSDGRYYVTQTSALHFLRNQATGTVRASAWGERPWGDGIGMALRRGDGSRPAHAPVAFPPEVWPPLV